jgi:hypothetical protein
MFILSGVHRPYLPGIDYDPFYAGVLSLIRFNDAAGTTVPVDEKGNVYTYYDIGATGTLSVIDSDSKYGNGCYFYDGTASGSGPFFYDLNIGSTNTDYPKICIEFCIKIISVGANGYIAKIFTLNSTSNAAGNPIITLGQNNGLRTLFIFIEGSQVQISNGQLAANTWLHVALQFNAVDGKLYTMIEGVKQTAEPVISNTWLKTATFGFGINARGNNGATQDIKWDSLRITYSATPRYTGSFTPLDSDYPSQ